MNPNNALTIAKNAKEQYLGDYDYTGIRIQEGVFGSIVGQNLEHCSYQWIDGNIQHNNRLDGVCAINLRYAEKEFRSMARCSASYPGGIAIILGSDQAEAGEDDNEIIMIDPIVIDIITSE